VNEDPLQFEAGMNFYGYVNNNPANWIDASGLAMTPAQCKLLLNQIKAMSIALGTEILKYNPATDGIGDSQ
jgi:hypothetical protein